jgi:dTMP kinase
MSDHGVFISLEGPDGAGKTTQLHRLAEKARTLGLPVTCTREPGGTPVGDSVREILLNPNFKEMIPLAEAFLYAAARAQLFHQVIRPALAQGGLVLCDRFIDSSLAYQAYGGSVDIDFVLDINLKAIEGHLPDRTFILDLPPESGLARRSISVADRVEQKSLEFHNRVRAGFLAISLRFPDRVVVVDATLSEDEVFSTIWHNVEGLMGHNG